MFSQYRSVFPYFLSHPDALPHSVGFAVQWASASAGSYTMAEHFAATPDHLYVKHSTGTQTVTLQRLEAELDELWNFVGAKTNRHWIWIAMDATTRQVIAFHVGDRSGQSAQALWKKLPAEYPAHATFYTDHYAAYTGIIPFAQHRAISTLTRKTNHVERLNCTLRQRVPRLVHATLSFSKKLSNHIGAIKYFSCDYNLTRGAALPG